MRTLKFAALLSALMCLFAMMAPAAITHAKTYKSALDKANARRPVVLFCYGANYDRVSQRTYEEFIKKRRLHQAMRNESFVLLCVPIYQQPNEKERREYSRIMGNAKLPAGIWSYPCLAVVDAKGNLRGIVQSADEMKSPEAAAAALRLLLPDYRAQESLLNKADKATGGRRLRLLCDAACFRTFMPRALESLDNMALVQKLDQMKPEEAHAYIRKLMATHCYSRRQRQEIIAAYAGHLRRNGASPARLRAVYTEMRNIDPDSIYGIYAEGAIEIWVLPHETPQPAPQPAKPADPAPDPAQGGGDAAADDGGNGKSAGTPEPAPAPAPAEPEEEEGDDESDDGSFDSGDEADEEDGDEEE